MGEVIVTEQNCGVENKSMRERRGLDFAESMTSIEATFD